MLIEDFLVDTLSIGRDFAYLVLFLFSIIIAWVALLFLIRLYKDDKMRRRSEELSSKMDRMSRSVTKSFLKNCLHVASHRKRILVIGKGSLKISRNMKRRYKDKMILNANDIADVVKAVGDRTHAFDMVVVTDKGTIEDATVSLNIIAESGADILCYGKIGFFEHLANNSWLVWESAIEKRFRKYGFDVHAEIKYRLFREEIIIYGSRL